MVEGWLFAGVKEEEEIVKTDAKFPITGKQLKQIFSGTSQTRCDEVAKLLNKFSDKFEINTPLRMAHFLGQIGTETGGLNKLSESSCYKESAIKSNFGKAKYCDLFEGYDAENLSSCPLPKCNPNLKSYTSKLKVKSKYVCTSDLFDYVYACRMGNDAPSSKDGSTFKGKSFIHLTGKGMYNQITNIWNNDTENINNKKDFGKTKANGGNFEELETNLEVALKASMYYWEMNKINDVADEDNTEKVTLKVNGGDNGIELRKKYMNSAKTVFNKK